MADDITYDEFDQAINDFGKEVVKQSRTNLSKSDSSASGSLKNSIKYTYKNLVLTFKMNQYGAFIDRGVRGHGKNTYKSTRNRSVARSLSGYAFRKGPVGPAAEKSFISWISRRNISIRNALGQVLSKKSTAFLLMRATGRYGIKPTKFFTDAYTKTVKKFDPILNDALTGDIENHLDNILDPLKQ